MPAGGTKNNWPHPAQRTRRPCMDHGMLSMTRHCGFGQRNFNCSMTASLSNDTNLIGNRRATLKESHAGIGR